MPGRYIPVELNFYDALIFPGYVTIATLFGLLRRESIELRCGLLGEVQL